MVPSSFLRVYEPLDEFAPKERTRWQAYIERGARLPSKVMYRDIAFEDSKQTGMLHPLVAEHAFVRRVNGAWYVCPWRVRLRMLVGLLAFRNNLPGEAAEAFVPEDQAERVIEELERLRRDDPDMRANIASAPWHVPLRWFVPFDDAEKIMTIENGTTRVRYETDWVTATVRLQRAVDVLKSSGLPEGVVETVEELNEWMAEFPRGSLIELDYGSVADLFSQEDLELDRSAGEIWASIEALETGDFQEASRRYSELMQWWSRVQALESAN
jgi:hypothetical protein